MKRSKMLFFVIAVAVIAIVVAIFVLNPGKEPVSPTNPTVTTDPTSPSGGNPVASNPTQPTGGEDVPTFPGSETEPTGPSTPVGPTEPTEPGVEPTEPSSGPSIDDILDLLRPTEPTTGPTEPTDPTSPGALPESSGKHYRNDAVYSKAITDSVTGEIFNVSFGKKVSGIGECIYLNPSVTCLSGSGNQASFQFHFAPAWGYLTTLTNQNIGNYLNENICSYFNRAFDRALPAGYVNEENPGTIWYMEDYGYTDTVAIDTLVYKTGELFATLRIYIVRNNNGIWAIDYVANTNLNDGIDSGISKYEEVMTLTADEMFFIDIMAKHKLCTSGIIDTAQADRIFAETPFVVIRPMGLGTYFEYASFLDDPERLIEGEIFEKYVVIAVSFRNVAFDGSIAPVTYYFTIARGATEDGNDEIVTLVLDHPAFMFVEGLDAANYPGAYN